MLAQRLHIAEDAERAHSTAITVNESLQLWLDVLHDVLVDARLCRMKRHPEHKVSFER